MIPFVYDTLLLFMVFVLFLAGKKLQKNGGKMLSKAGLSAIIVFTFNEGLRFGRGIDYNEYWERFEEISKGFDSDRDVAFVYLYKLLSEMDIPYQGFVLLQSFMFILGSLFILKKEKEILPLALPLFVLLSIYDTENLIRWYFGFSFILIGLSYLLENKKVVYFVFCIIGCSFHIGLAPLPLLFFVFCYFKKPIIHPFISIPLFVFIGLFFRTEFMQQFTDWFEMISVVSERAERYANNADFWLEGGNAGRFRSPFPGKGEMLFLFFLIWYGYKFCNKSRTSVYFYNLFLFGFLLRPIGLVMELVNRYDSVFYLFRAVVCAYILYDLIKCRVIKSPVIKIAGLIIILNMCFTFFKDPITKNPKRFMYVWNHEKETYDSMIDMWTKEKDKAASKAESKSR